MSISTTTIPSLLSPNLSFKSKPSFPFPRQQFPTTTKLHVLSPQFTRNLIGFSPRFTPSKRFATNDDESVVVGLNEAEKELQESNTMPGRFKIQFKEASEPPFKWPWFVGQCLISSLSLLFVIQKMWAKFIEKNNNFHKCERWFTSMYTSDGRCVLV